MYLCVRVSILTHSTILIFDFGIAPTVWLFHFFCYVIVSIEIFPLCQSRF